MRHSTPSNPVRPAYRIQNLCFLTTDEGPATVAQHSTPLHNASACLAGTQYARLVRTVPPVPVPGGRKEDRVRSEATAGR